MPPRYPPSISEVSRMVPYLPGAREAPSTATPRGSRSLASGCPASGVSAITARARPSGQKRSDIAEGPQGGFDVLVGVLHRHGPDVLRPVRLRQDAAVDHADPERHPGRQTRALEVLHGAHRMAPEEQRSRGPRGHHVRLEPEAGDDL